VAGQGGVLIIIIIIFIITSSLTIRNAFATSTSSS